MSGEIDKLFLHTVFSFGSSVRLLQPTSKVDGRIPVIVLFEIPQITTKLLGECDSCIEKLR